MEGVATPASGVAVVAVPYNRDSVVASLERAQGSARPHTAQLDSLFDRFRGPFIEHFNVGRTVAAVRDSVERGLLPDSALPTATARLERSRAALAEVRAEMAGRGDSLRAEVRLWEDSTYRTFDSVVKALAEQAGRRPVVDTTDASGNASLGLPASDVDWWITARSWDVTDPNMSWSWNVPATTDTVTLDAASGRRLPRY